MVDPPTPPLGEGSKVCENLGQKSVPGGGLGWWFATPRPLVKPSSSPRQALAKPSPSPPQALATLSTPPELIADLPVVIFAAPVVIFESTSFRLRFSTVWGGF